MCASTLNRPHIDDTLLSSGSPLSTFTMFVIERCAVASSRCECYISTILSRYVFFFFSSRRRHTRLQGDWSSDVCSSDLPGLSHQADQAGGALRPRWHDRHHRPRDRRTPDQGTGPARGGGQPRRRRRRHRRHGNRALAARWRSEEHTSELQSPCNLVCRLLLEKKK